MQGSDGYFYGTTSALDGELSGTVFRIGADGAKTFTTLYNFTAIGVAPYTVFPDTNIDGANPNGALVQGSDGNFYGTTGGGGLSGAGTIFRLTIVPEFLRSTLTTNGTLNLTWSTEAGGTYQLQFNSQLSSTNWTNLRSPATASGATLSTTDSVTNGQQRFYRLMLAP